MSLPKLIVFDMDGVLIDVSRSYRETVRKTARLFFQGSEGGDALPDPLFPMTDLARFKRTGGLNNDWELTCQVISLLFADMNTATDGVSSDPWTNHSEIIRVCDASRLSRFLKTSPAPLMELYARYGRRRDAFVSACFKGDVGTGNVIKQIFQEVYLGPGLFQSIYGFKPRFATGQGLIDQEALLMDKSILEDLHQRHILAIATGRPRVEADHPLDRFSIRNFFDIVVTLDDCLQEEERIFKERSERASLTKPHPFMLDLIPAATGKAFGGAYYLGDMPDDMRAARLSRTGYRGVGVALGSTDQLSAHKELLEAGAAHILHDYSELDHIIG